MPFRLINMPVDYRHIVGTVWAFHRIPLGAIDRMLVCVELPPWISISGLSIPGIIECEYFTRNMAVPPFALSLNKVVEQIRRRVTLSQIQQSRAIKQNYPPKQFHRNKRISQNRTRTDGFLQRTTTRRNGCSTASFFVPIGTSGNLGKSGFCVNKLFSGIFSPWYTDEFPLLNCFARLQGPLGILTTHFSCRLSQMILQVSYEG